MSNLSLLAESVFELSPEEVVKVIKNGRVRVSTVLVAVTGLPYSGNLRINFLSPHMWGSILW